jgi:hypothetical protein
MSTINRLSSVDVLQPSDQIPVWDSSNGDTRKASMSTLLAFVESYFADPDYSTRIVAPAVDYFTVDIGATGDSIWMIVNPTLNFTNGAITLPPATSAVNDQQITVVFTSSVSTFVITSSGATVLGAPTQINGYDSFSVRYNSAQQTWYNIGTTGSGSGGGVSQIVRQDFTGDGTTTTFALLNIPSALGNELQIFIDGVYQERAGYTVSGVNIIFSEAPPALSNIEVLGWAVSLGAETSANLVSYTPAGTGAVLTTVQAKLRESVSVKDFGAVGDGTTDDRAAIELAFNSGANAVYFPTGTYAVSAPVVAANSALKYVSGSGVTLVSTSSSLGSLEYMLDFGTNNVPVDISGLTFSVDATNTAAGAAAITWYGGTFPFSFKNFQGGLYIPEGSNVHECRFQNLFDALYIAGVGTLAYGLATKANNNYFTANNLTLTFIYCNNAEFSGNVAYLGSEVTFPSCKNLIITNNTLFLPGTPCIDVGGSAALSCDKIIISNNIAYGRDGIVVENGAHDITIEGNQCYPMANSPDGVGIGITTNTGGQEIFRLIVSGNSILRYDDANGTTGQYAYGIYIDANIDKPIEVVSVHNNTILSPSVGVYFEAFDPTPIAQNLHITDNIVTDIRSSGIVAAIATLANISRNHLVSNATVGSSTGMLLSSITNGIVKDNTTRDFVTAHYNLDGTMGNVVIDSCDHNAPFGKLVIIGGTYGGNQTITNTKFPGGGTPAVGTWVQGSQIINPSPASAGYYGAVCTVTGTPGTWASYGLIA